MKDKDNTKLKGKPIISTQKPINKPENKERIRYHKKLIAKGEQSIIKAERGET